MKRVYFAVFIAVVVCATVGAGFFFLNQANNQMTQAFEKIEIAIDNKNKTKALKLCETAEKQWVECEKSLTYFVNHSEISEIGVDIASIKPLIKRNEFAEGLSILSGAKVKLKHLTKMEKIQ